MTSKPQGYVNDMILRLFTFLWLFLFQNTLHANEFIVRIIPQKTFSRTSFFSPLSRFGNFTAQGLNKKFYRLNFEHEIPFDQVEKVLKNHPHFVYLEPNFIFQIPEKNFRNQSTAFSIKDPNDPLLFALWGQNKIQTPKLWEQNIIGNQQVVVAVIDTGVDYNHPDLKENIFINEGESGEKATNGVDDDQNGYIDDLHGWNFSTYNNDPMDVHDHGTHCAGIIGAIGNNREGITGVNWNVKILPIRFMDEQGAGSTADAILGFEYAKKMGAKIFSNSWGGSYYSQALDESIQDLEKAGILFVAAAGNEGRNLDTFPSYPASSDSENIISVAATNIHDQLAFFSNKSLKLVDVSAPGVDILSTVRNGKYEFHSGTSMATPFIAGSAALLLSAHPQWDYKEIKKRLIETSDAQPLLYRSSQSHGRINLARALSNDTNAFPNVDESKWKTEPFILESTAYPPHADLWYEVKRPGSSFIRVLFEYTNFENNSDFLEVTDSEGRPTETITGSLGWYVWSAPVKGDTLKLHLTSDGEITSYGFRIVKVQTLP